MSVLKKIAIKRPSDQQAVEYDLGAPMTGASSNTAGTAGYVPAPAAGDHDKFLRGDGTWGAASASASGGTLRIVPFSIGANSWTLANGLYTATYLSAYVTATSVEFVEYTDSFRQAIRGDLSWAKVTGYGGITFTTTVQPVGTLQGEIRVIDSEDGSVAIITEQTALPTIRDVPFTVAVADWSLNNNGMYEAVFATAYVTATSHDFIEFNESIENATDGIKVSKAESSGAVVGLKFTSRRVPAGAISGTVTPLDNADGKVAIVLQDTVVPIANGGTGANTLQGAQDALGITELNSKIVVINETLPSSINTDKEFTIGYSFDKYFVAGHCAINNINSLWYSNVDDITVLGAQGNKLRIKTASTSYTGSSIKIILMKYQ